MSQNTTSVTHAMLLAAGLGTRLKPFTDKHPKALAVINGKTLLQRNVEFLQSFGISNVLVNVHHFAVQITELIDKNNGWGSDISISDETDEVLETGGGLLRTAPYFKAQDNFVLMNTDILTDLNINALVQQQQNSEALATLAITNRQSSRYFLFNEQQHLCGWRNVKTGQEKIKVESITLQQKAFSGIHVISNKIFEAITQRGKFSMVDVYLDLCKSHIIQGFEHNDSKFIDVGKPEAIDIAEKLFI